MRTPQKQVKALLAQLRTIWDLRTNAEVWARVADANTTISTAVKQETGDRVSTLGLTPYAECSWTIALTWNAGPGCAGYRTLHVSAEEITHPIALLARVVTAAKEVKA
jgi:hypothetical protein